MRGKFRIHMFMPFMLLLFSMIILPNDTARAEIEDGTYEIEYEMLEEDSDNTSIADGYFTSPATLMVENDTKKIQMTVTSTSMIESLRAPTGPVTIISEDEDEETKTVRFKVDEDLSEPVDLEMHVIVPDLYDMEHVARADFDVENLEEIDPPEDASEDLGTWHEPDGNDEASDDEEDKSNQETVETAADNANEETAESADSEDNNSSTALWITLAVIGVLIISGILFWIFRKKRTS